MRKIKVKTRSGRGEKEDADFLMSQLQQDEHMEEMKQAWDGKDEE